MASSGKAVIRKILTPLNLYAEGKNILEKTEKQERLLEENWGLEENCGKVRSFVRAIIRQR